MKQYLFDMETVDKRHLISGFPEPVFKTFTISARDLVASKGEFKPNFRMIAKELAEFLISNGYVYSVGMNRLECADFFEYKFGLYVYKKVEKVP